MKGLNIKKLAAVGAGAALLGTAFAPIVSALDLTKSDIFSDTGSPFVKVVVGSSSAPSDGVWAGNIAAAIANKARTLKTVSVSGAPGEDGGATVTDISAKLVVGGTVTFSNAKTIIVGESPTTGTADMNSVSGIQEVAGLELTKSSFGSTAGGLIEESATIRYNGDTLSRTFKEKLGIKADVYFDRDKGGGVADLETEIKAADLNYVVDLGTGIPVYESTGSTTKFTDGSNDNIVIPFLGDHYLVREVNKASGSGFVRLIKSEETSAFLQGDIIPDLPGKNGLAGQTVSVRIDSVIATGPAASTYSADVTLIDEEGNERSTKTVNTGDNINEVLTVNGLEAISTVLYVDSIGVDAQTGAGTVKVLVGTNLVDLYKDKGYPYDSTSSGPYAYQVDLVLSSDGNYYTKIVLKNQDRVWRDAGSGTNVSPPLYAPSPWALTSTGADGSHKASFLDNVPEGTLGKDLFAVEFQGLETDAINTIKLYDYTLEYVDASDRKHKVPMYVQLNKDASNSSFSFDGRTIYYSSSSTDQDLNVGGGNPVTGLGMSINGVPFVQAYDSNAEGNFGVFTIAGVGDANVATGSVLDVNGFYFELVQENFGDANSAVFRADGNVTFSMAPLTSSSSSDFLETYTDGNGNAAQHSIFFMDANTSDYKAYNGNTVGLKGLDDITYQYALFADSTATGDLYLLLDRQAFDGRYDADIRLWGTDTNEDMTFAVDQNASATPHAGRHSRHNQFGGRPYFWPNFTDMGGAQSGIFYVAAFGVETAGNSTGAADATADFDTNVYIDTATGDAPVIASGSQLSAPTSDINYNDTLLDGSFKFSLDEDPATTSAQNKAYNDYGSYFEVTSGAITIQVPDNTRRPVLVVSMAGSSSEVTGGEELTLAEGETGTTSTGTSVTLDTVTYTASCGGGDTGTCQAEPESYFEPATIPEQLVYLDTEAPTGTLVLVGGHLVNRLTAQIAGIEDQLTAPGDGASSWRDDASGNFVVAGYTPQDTVSAARDFISSVEAIDMMG